MSFIDSKMFALTKWTIFTRPQLPEKQPTTRRNIDTVLSTKHLQKSKTIFMKLK